MDISVIIPTYKPQEYLWECLKSLYNQSLDKDRFEVILILNGCKEPWSSEISNWIDSHSQINLRFYHTMTSGVSNARNIGLKYAIGQYITFIDDDDFVSPSYLEDLLVISSGDCVAICDSIYIDDLSGKVLNVNYHHKQYLKIKDRKNPTLFQCRSFFNGPCMKLIHRNIIGDKKFDKRFSNGEDGLFMTFISNQIRLISVAPSSAVYYRRIRSNSATTTKRSRFHIIKNCMKILFTECSYWGKDPMGYNIKFMLSRILADIKSMLL